jgi:hypothetical protein
MIKMDEFRLGNYLLHKTAVRIKMVPCTMEHFSLFEKQGGKDLFPVVLSADIFTKAGFIENKDYELLPDAREFKLPIPVNTNHQTMIHGYVKNNKECFARAFVNNLPCSNPLYSLHQLQNLYYSLTAGELSINL